MILIFGFRSSIERLATLLLQCQRCQTPAAHHIRRWRKRFTLFFIPTFTLQKKHFVSCTMCGSDFLVAQEEAERLVALALAQADPAPAPASDAFTSHVS